MCKSELDREAEEYCRKLAEYDDFEYTMDSLSSTSKTKGKTKGSVKVRTELCWGTGCREAVRGTTCPALPSVVHTVDQQDNKP